MNREEIKETLNEMIEKFDKRVVSRFMNGEKYPEIKEEILKETAYLPEESKMGERIYHILNDIYKRLMCPQCKSQYLKYNNGKYQIYCSSKCSCLYTEDKRKQTCLNKFGYEHALQNKEVQEKQKQTCLNKYGYENPYQNKEVQEKQKHTMNDRYGHEYYLLSDKHQEKEKEKTIKYIDKFLKDIHIKMIGEYNQCQEDTKFKCLKCGKEFTSCFFNIQQRKRCPYCSTEYNQSKEEIELYEYLQSIFKTEIVQNETQIIKNPKTNYPLELDFYIPEKKTSIEYNGLYWHNDNHKDKDYHLMKTNLCKEKGIQLIHIFEDEWINKKDGVKLKLKQLLDIIDNNIDLNQCRIEDINNVTAAKFLNRYSIDGDDDAYIKLGAFHNNKLISIMTFSEKDNIFNIESSCSKYNIKGIEDKLLEHFKKNYNWKEINKYVDIRWSDGKLYEQLGFILKEQTNPNCWWFYNSYLKRIKDSEFNEADHSKKYLKIYDCGYLKYKLKNKGIQDGSER